MNEWTNELTKNATKQPTNQPTHKRSNQTTKQFNHPTNESTKKPNQSTNNWTNPQIKESTKQTNPTYPSRKQPTKHPTNEPSYKKWRNSHKGLSIKFKIHKSLFWQPVWVHNYVIEVLHHLYSLERWKCYSRTLLNVSKNRKISKIRVTGGGGIVGEMGSDWFCIKYIKYHIWNDEFCMECCGRLSRSIGFCLWFRRVWFQIWAPHEYRPEINQLCFPFLFFF